MTSTSTVGACVVCVLFGPEGGPLEMYLGSTWTRRKNREKDSERYLPESGHIRERYSELERVTQ